MVGEGFVVACGRKKHLIVELVSAADTIGAQDFAYT